MLPAILGLGGLTAKIIATAVIPRVVRAISQSFSATRPPEPCPPPAVEGISSGPEPTPAPVLSGVSATRIRSRKWGYAGLWHHGPSGLDLATYRLYDAKNKRWISRDPLGEGVDFNLYTYCRNSPVNIRDTKGLQPGDVIPEVPAERPGGFGDIDVLPNSMPIPASGGPAVEPITPSSPDDNYLVGDWFIRVKFKAFCVCPPGTEVVESGWDFVDTQDVAELHGSGSYAKIRRSPGRIGIGFKCKCKKKGSQCEPFNGTVQDGSIEWSDPSRQRKDINLTVT